ncbi:MAG: CDP-alcohol phosphatidyltransferase family protein [Dehalococcoidia bacterium]
MTPGGAAKPANLDGLVSRLLNRPLSRPVARLLAHTPVTPNQVTVVSLLAACGAGWLLVAGHNIWAGFAIHASSVIDGVDGDLARRTGRSSRFGAIFDAVLDRYADAAIFGGMGWWSYRHESWPAALLLGLAALTGAFAISYSRARAEASAGIALNGGFIGLASRDVRLLLAALGCVFGLVYVALAAIAVTCHATVVHRLLYLRRATTPKL